MGFYWLLGKPEAFRKGGRQSREPREGGKAATAKGNSSFRTVFEAGRGWIFHALCRRVATILIAKAVVIQGVRN